MAPRGIVRSFQILATFPNLIVVENVRIEVQLSAGLSMHVVAEKALSQINQIQRHKVQINNAQPIKGISSINELQARVLRRLIIKKPTQEAQMTLV